MRKMKSKVFVGFLSLLIATLVVWQGQAQSQETYPTRPIEIICPYAAGGASDLFLRTTASFLNKKWGVPVNVVNKTGGNAIPGVLSVYNASPDGYSMLGDGNSTSSMLGVAVKDVPFKIMDRTFVSMAIVAPVIFVVAPNAPFKDLKEVAAEARRDPGSFKWTWTGGGDDTVGFTMRQFFKAIDVDILKTKVVSTSGGGQGMILVAGGHVTLGGTVVGGAASYLKGGTLRGLAITSKDRFPSWPDIPTTVESGYPSVNIMDWKGISGPPKLPAYVVAKWEKALEEILRDPEMIVKLKNIGAMPAYADAEATRKFVLKDTDELSKLWGAISVVR